jgi:hypothetical protein
MGTHKSDWRLPLAQGRWASEPRLTAFAVVYPSLCLSQIPKWMRTWSLRIVGKISRLALSLLHLLATTTVATFKSRTALQLENVALQL